MHSSDRENRLRQELEAITQLRASSSILDFQITGDPPDRYLLTFRGRGIARTLSSPTDVEWIERHEIEMRLPFAYPAQPPDICWVTAILHPNVSFSGFLQWEDIGPAWSDQITLDMVCERLWDVARLAYVNLPGAANFAAKNWFESPQRLAVPVDVRSLRDRLPPAGVNVIRYQRRGVEPPPQPTVEKDVLYIDENTPTPLLPRGASPARRTRRGNDEDIFFIGDE